MANYRTKLGLNYTFDKYANIPDEEAEQRTEAFRDFKDKLFVLYREDLTPNQKKTLTKALIDLSTHYVYGRVTFKFDTLLKVKPDNAKLVVDTLKGLNDEINKNFYPEHIQN